MKHKYNLKSGYVCEYENKHLIIDIKDGTGITLEKVVKSRYNIIVKDFQTNTTKTIFIHAISVKNKIEASRISQLEKINLSTLIK